MEVWNLRGVQGVEESKPKADVPLAVQVDKEGTTCLWTLSRADPGRKGVLVLVRTLEVM